MVGVEYPEMLCIESRLIMSEQVFVCGESVQVAIVSVLLRDVRRNGKQVSTNS